MLNRPHLAVVDKIEQALGEIRMPYGSDVGKHELGQNPGPLPGGSTLLSAELFFVHSVTFSAQCKKHQSL